MKAQELAAAYERHATTEAAAIAGIEQQTARLLDEERRGRRRH